MKLPEIAEILLDQFVPGPTVYKNFNAFYMTSGPPVAEHQVLTFFLSI